MLYVMAGCDASYLSLQRYNLSVHCSEHSLALVLVLVVVAVAGLRPRRHGNQIVVVDVNATRQAMLVTLLFARTSSPRRPAQRSHTARPSASPISDTTPPYDSRLNHPRTLLRLIFTDNYIGKSKLLTPYRVLSYYFTGKFYYIYVIPV